MYVFAFISWWYSDGWKSFARRLGEFLRNTLDFFSMGLLLKTLFAPFRQISAGTPKLVDRLISRFVGFFTRLFLLIMGSLAVLVEAVVIFTLLVLWPLLPLLPFVALVLMFMGVKF